MSVKAYETIELCLTLPNFLTSVKAYETIELCPTLPKYCKIFDTPWCNYYIILYHVLMLYLNNTLKDKDVIGGIYCWKNVHVRK